MQGENMTCPDQSCHEKLKTVCEKVHGKDGLESKVSRKALGGVVVSVIGVVAMFILYALTASATDKAEMQNIKIRQAVVVDKLDTAVGKQGEIQKNQQSIMLKIQKIQDDIEHESERSRKVDEVILKKLSEIQRSQ